MRSIIVANGRDDTAVLVTLTAREIEPKAKIVASIREAENQHLLRQSGADTVVVSPRPPPGGCSYRYHDAQRRG